VDGVSTSLPRGEVCRSEDHYLTYRATGPRLLSTPRPNACSELAFAAASTSRHLRRSRLRPLRLGEARCTDG
jgi:hypothetical protein